MAENAGTIYSDVRIQLDKLKADISSVSSQINGFKNFNAGAAGQTQKNWETGFKGINLAGTAAAIALTASFKKMIGTFAETEQSLANVRAVTGATAEEFERIEQAVEEAGQTTRFTASEAANAMYYLASAGFDATQSIDALDGVLLLAGATGADLAMTSETLASAISAFNLEASDATRVSNVFAAAIGNSQATMDKLAVSMRYVAPVASSFNQSIEGTVGLLQILYNNGFEASQAGTALRSALADLANATSPANDKLRELGVSFDEINPQTNSYADIIDVLNAKVTDASDIMAIFGDRAGPAMIKLIEAGRSKIEEYTEAVTGTNAAAEQYAIQNDTLAGSFDKFKSAAEAASNSIIKELAPTLRDLLSVGTAVLNFITGLPKPLKALIGGAGAAGAAISTLSVAMRLFGISASAAFGPVGLLLAALTGIGFAIASTTQEEREFNRALNQTYKNIDDIDVGAANLATELAVLQSKTNLSNKEQERMAEIMKTLKGQYPELTDDILANAQALATQRIELAKVNKQNIQADIIDLQKRRLALEQEFEDKFRKGRKAAEKELLRQWNDRNAALLNNEATIKEASKAQREYAESLKDLSAKELIDLAKTSGVALGGLADVYEDTTTKIDDIDKAIDTGRRALSTLDASIGTNTVKLAGLTKETEDNTDARDENTSAIKLQEEYEKAVLKVQKEEAIGLITKADLYKQQINLLETYIRSLLESGDASESTISELIVKLDEYRAKLKEIEDAEKNRKEREKEATDLEKRLAQSRIDNMADGAAKELEQFKLDLEDRLQALRDAGATEEEIEKEKNDAIAAYEKQVMEKRVDDIISAYNLLTNAIQSVQQQTIANLQAELEQFDATYGAELKILQDKQEAGEELTAAEKARLDDLAAKEKKLRKEKYDAELKAFNTNKALGIINTTIAGAEAAIQAYKALAGIPIVGPALGAAAAAAVAGLTAVNVGLIASQEPPPPPDLATGAVILPKKGGTLVNVAEKGAPEVAIGMGPEGTAVIQELASRLAGYINNRPVILYLDGKIVADSTSNYQRNGNVRAHS